jgi:hypothetical protein
VRTARRKSDLPERAATLLTGRMTCRKIDQNIRRGMRFANRYQSVDGTPFAPPSFHKNMGQIQVISAFRELELSCIV